MSHTNPSSPAARDPIRASRLLRGLLPDGVVAFEALAPVGPETLAEEEARCIARAAAKRVAQFATGRACARRALAELAIHGFALRVGADREPLWPAGIAGSITHTDGFCAAAVARRTVHASLGIDAERRDAVHRRLWRQIATPAELAVLEALAHDDAAQMAAAVFSAKEAFFKCQFPLTREWLNFSDVTVTAGASGLSVEPTRRLALEALAAPPWPVRYRFSDSLVVTAMSLPAPAA